MITYPVSSLYLWMWWIINVNIFVPVMNTYHEHLFNLCLYDHFLVKFLQKFSVVTVSNFSEYLQSVFVIRVHTLSFLSVVVNTYPEYHASSLGLSFQWMLALSINSVCTLLVKNSSYLSSLLVINNYLSVYIPSVISLWLCWMNTFQSILICSCNEY